MKKTVRVLIACAMAVAVVSLGLVSVPLAYARQTAVITVDAGNELGVLNNPAWYHNQIKSLPAGDLDRVREVGSARVTRVWVKPYRYYERQTGTYDFSGVYNYFDNTAAHSDRLLVNVDQCDQALMDLSAPDTCRAVLKAGIKHYKQRYPLLRYIEVFNEPDKTWTPGPNENPAIPVDAYYEWYRIAYSVVNEVNAELYPDLPLGVGGPAAYTFNEDYLRGFLDRFAADPDPAKRLDFISYHEYRQRANPATVETRKPAIRSWLTNRGLTADTPVFVTEYGVFPGGPNEPNGHGTTYEDDLLTQAAAMATLGNYYVRGGMDMPMHWVFNHDTNERKSMFVDGVDGAVHPYYNVVKMQRMLKSTRIDSQSSALTTQGIGVNALATKDGTGIAVLMTNYQWTTGTDEYNVRVDIGNLPAEFASMQIGVERYLVDATTSNYAYDPAQANLQRVERYVLPAGSPASASLPLGRNAISLLVLTPIGHAEAEDLPAAASAGDLVQSIPDSEATGGRISKLTANAPGDFVSYPVPVPRAGTYSVIARMKKTPERGIAQLSIDGTPQGPQIDTYSSGYSYTEVDLGTRTFDTAGTKSFTFTLVGTSGNAYTLGVDHIELVPLPVFRTELEDTTPRASAGDHIYNLPDPLASGGRLSKLTSNAVGDWLRFSVHVPAAGQYTLSLAVKTFNNRASCQVSVNDVNVGDPLDMYSPAAAFLTQQVGTVVVDRPGSVAIACQVTGKHPASSGYEIAIDYVEFGHSS